MKKQLVIIGTIVLLIVVGLSGCLENDYVNVYDLRNKPNDYLDKSIVVKAHYYAYESSIYDITPLTGIPLEINEGVGESILIDEGEYYFRGTLKRYPETPENTYFEVSEILTEPPAGGFSLITDNTCAFVALILVIILLPTMLYLEKRKKREKRKEKAGCKH